MDMNRLLPGVFAALALLACFLPYGSTTQGTVLALPGMLAQTASFMGGFSQRGIVSSAAETLSSAAQLSYLVYLVPLAAGFVIVGVLRGIISKQAQIGAAAVWIGAGIIVPNIAIALVINATPLGGLSGSPLANLGAGAWLLLGAAAGALLTAMGFMKFVPSPAPPQEDQTSE